jgi:transketolase
LDQLRKRILEMAFLAQEGHVPSAFSIVDGLRVIYSVFDLNPGGSDTFVLSKGHGCLALYAVLEAQGLLSKEEIESFAKHDSKLGGHPDRTKIEAVSASTGSLGHGLPMAVGIAYSKAYLSNSPVGRVITIIGDGECNEGAVWEAALLASHHKLRNLIVWIDYNHSGDRAISSDLMRDKWQSFGFCVSEVDAHQESAIRQVLSRETHRPLAVIAHATKGKGISFMENAPEWHHKILDKETLESALKELR